MAFPSRQLLALALSRNSQVMQQLQPSRNADADIELRDNLKSLQADLNMLLCAQLVPVGEHTGSILCNHKSLQRSEAQHRGYGIQLSCT